MKSIQSMFTGCLLGLALLASSSAYAADGTLSLQSKQISADSDYEIELELNTECAFITGNNVNIRRGPGAEHGVITQLNRGDGVRALYREGNWVRLVARVYGFAPNESFEPLDGWVHNQYVNGCSEDQFDQWRD